MTIWNPPFFTELIELKREGYERLAIKFPVMGLSITNMISNSFRAAVTREYRPSKLKSLVVIPAREDVTVEAFLKRLERELSHYGPVYILTSKPF